MRPLSKVESPRGSSSSDIWKFNSPWSIALQATQCTYSNDPAVIAQYQKDKLLHDRWPGRTVTIMCELAIDIEKHPCKFPLPVLIQHGTKCVAPIELIRKWADSCIGDNITFNEWPDFYHELNNDLGRDAVFAYTLDWIEKSLKLLTSITIEVTPTNL
ncbi:unnamed protein product [Didymodactylos carnosus]|uniref:Serine aminopeptidase S33 domain-containing protein n=1 Tax=Didymodactylos carnosus TaxID=1234261 RepID=A0A815N6X6_9BILA|nr:unnamed protein product [Didymodactylos carnosus]CAF4312627.1 unnamed protein product [Didymodactylos carnosus]